MEGGVGRGGGGGEGWELRKCYASSMICVWEKRPSPTLSLGKLEGQQPNEMIRSLVLYAAEMEEQDHFPLNGI